MNGRIYDPKLGRMLQADPFIQSPTNSQSLNRYSYVLNNPLSYTDPSGYFSLKSLVKFGMKLAGAWTVHKFLNKYPVLNSLVSGALNAIPGCQVWCSALFNASGSFVATGSLSAAFRVGAISYATGYISAGIGASGLNPYQQAFVAGMAGGITAELQGGKFGHGFLAAGISAAAGGGGYNQKFDFGNFVRAAIVGGTVSELAGGKFANGAMTAAMLYTASTIGRTGALGKKRDSEFTEGSVESDETPQERVNRLASLVYGDFPSLPQANIEAVDDLAGYSGIYLGGRSIQIATNNSSDTYLRTTIFHELLHVDEALITVGGSYILYRAHERIFHFFRHDPWINLTEIKYSNHLDFGDSIPNINTAPWRKP